LDWREFEVLNRMFVVSLELVSRILAFVGSRLQFRWRVFCAMKDEEELFGA
jgi:hypothetical protein